MQNMHRPHFWYKKIVKHEKIAIYVYLTLGLLAAGRPSVKVKNMQNMQNMQNMYQNMASIC
jgi:hypothetical protein